MLLLVKWMDIFVAMNVDDDNQLTGTVIGAAITVHRALGPGLDEAAYESALSRKLSVIGISHVCQVPLPLVYKEAVLDCGFRLDILVEDRLPLELKAVDALLPIHDAQLLTYLRLSNLPLGLIINFDVAVLKQGVRRRVLTRPLATTTTSSLPMLRGDHDPTSIGLLDAAFEVHRTLGPGLLRSAYESSLCHELKLRSIGFLRNHRHSLVFEGSEIGHCAEIPLLVCGHIPVFCLSTNALTKIQEIRLLARMRHLNAAHGYLLNFGAPTLAHGIRHLTLS
ncbi:MAG: GxxExxY protein [Rhodanobacter sp.]